MCDKERKPRPRCYPLGVLLHIFSSWLIASRKWAFSVLLLSSIQLHCKREQKRRSPSSRLMSARRARPAQLKIAFLIRWLRQRCEDAPVFFFFQNENHIGNCTKNTRHFLWKGRAAFPHCIRCFSRSEFFHGIQTFLTVVSFVCNRHKNSGGKTSPWQTITASAGRLSRSLHDFNEPNGERFSCCFVFLLLFFQWRKFMASGTRRENVGGESERAKVVVFIDTATRWCAVSPAGEAHVADI